MPTPTIQTLVTDAQQVLNLDSISAVRSVVAVALANANTGTPLNPNLTTQQLWNEFYQVVTKPKSDIESIIANQLMKFLYAPPAPGGVGANHEVIFNNNGVLAGDSKFLWDDALNKLDIDGSATISGDLTVDTSTLKVDSTNNRVGIGTASPAATLIVRDGLNRNLLVASDATQLGSSGIAIGGFTDGAAGYAPLSIISSSTQFGIGGSTAMTLNATGLSVGVAPSAWGANFRVTQVGQAGSVYGAAVFGYYGTKFNLYNDNTNDIAISTNFVGEYRFELLNGSHVWLNKSTAGSVGVAQTLTQAMTLTAGGELLVGTTSASVGSNNGFRLIDSGGRLELGSVNSANSSIGLSMYSTGAAAYRFYVGWGGTVYATNTTISAISDARLKENVQDIDVGLGAILALKPRKFDWKAGKGKDIKGDRGFIAQEFEQVFPQLVDQWADEAPEGEAPYKSVRQDLIPVLVKAIQELAAEVNALKNA